MLSTPVHPRGVGPEQPPRESEYLALPGPTSSRIWPDRSVIGFNA